MNYSELAFAKQRVEELEAQLHLLQESIGLHLDLPTCFGLTKHQTKFVALIYRNRVARKELIMQAMYGDKLDAPCDQVLNVMLSNIRRKLRPYNVEIKTSWADGYYMAQATKDIIAKMIAEECQKIPA